MAESFVRLMFYVYVLAGGLPALQIFRTIVDTFVLLLLKCSMIWNAFVEYLFRHLYLWWTLFLWKENLRLNLHFVTVPLCKSSVFGCEDLIS